MANPTEALDNAIAEVEEQLLKDSKPTTETQDTSTTDTDDIIDTGDDNNASSTTEDLTEDQLKEAQTLYKLLLNPEMRNGVVAALAEQTGLLKNTPLETRQEVKEAKKGIAEIIDEALPEFPGLSKKLGPVIESIIQAERDERSAEMEKITVQNIEREVANELSSLARDTKGESIKLKAKMNQLMNEVQPGPNVSIKSYIRTLYTLATASSKTKATMSAEMADKIRKNANNAPDRLKSAGNGAARTSEMPSKKMSLNESVNWAIEQAFNNAKK